VNHRAGFESIAMLVKIESSDTAATDLEKVFERIEAICPVLSMLDKGVKTAINFKLNE